MKRTATTVHKLLARSLISHEDKLEVTCFINCRCSLSQPVFCFSYSFIAVENVFPGTSTAGSTVHGMRTLFVGLHSRELGGSARILRPIVFMKIDETLFSLYPADVQHARRISHHSVSISNCKRSERQVEFFTQYLRHSWTFFIQRDKN